MDFRLCVILLLFVSACQKEHVQGYAFNDDFRPRVEGCAIDLQNRDRAVFSGESNFLGFSGACDVTTLHPGMNADEDADEKKLNFNVWDLDVCFIYGNFNIRNVNADMVGDTIEILPRRLNDVEDGLTVGEYTISDFDGYSLLIIEKYDILPLTTHRSWIYLERVNKWETQWEGSMQLALYSTINGGRWDDPNRPDTLFVKNVQFVANEVKG